MSCFLKFAMASLIVTLASIAVAKNGAIVFISDHSGSWQLYTANPDGSNEKRISHLRSTDLDGWAPAISPDGQKVAFTYGHGGSNGTPTVVDIFVISIDGAGLTRVTHNGQSLFPRWSPDGTHLVYTKVSKRSGAGVITVLSADGTGAEKALTNDLFDNFGPFYSPDGGRIFYDSSAGGYVSAVWVMDADGSNKQRLTEAAFRGSATDISPDGQHVLLQNNQNSPAALTNDVFVMNPDGTGLTQLTHLKRRHHNGGATYSPDGSAIAFQGDFLHPAAPDQFGEFDIFTMNADGTNIQGVIKNAGSCPTDGNCVNPFWGPKP